MFKPSQFDEEKLDLAYRLYFAGLDAQDIARRLEMNDTQLRPYLKEVRHRRLMEIAAKDRQEKS